VTARSVTIARIYDGAPAGKAAASESVRVLVDRLWPRGISKAKLKFDLWPKELSPSNELRKWYGHDPKRAAAFRRRYLAEIAEHPDALAALRTAVKSRNVVLLTATRELELSHAAVLRDLLLSRGKAPKTPKTPKTRKAAKTRKLSKARKSAAKRTTSRKRRKKSKRPTTRKSS